MSEQGKDNSHNIRVVLDYRVAHTIIGGLRMWLDKLDKMLDEGVQKNGEIIPCRRKGDRRNGKDTLVSNDV